MRFPATVAALLCTAALSAQTTYVVSATPGPDVDFADLPAAVAAAAPGDVIRMRAGTYTPTTISTGLIIRGTQGVNFSNGVMQISGVPVDQQVVLRDVDLSGDVNDVNPARVRIELCLGVVHLQSVTMNINPQTTLRTGEGVRVRLSPRTSLTRCTIQGGVCVNTELTTVAVTDCDLTGSGRSGLFGGGQPNPSIGLSLGSFASINGGTYRGTPGDAANNRGGGPALRTGGGCRIGGVGTEFLAGDAMGTTQGVSAIRVDNSAGTVGGVVIDEEVLLTPTNGAPAVNQLAMGLAEIRRVPAAQWSSPEWFLTPTFRMDGPPNALYGLVASPPVGTLFTPIGVLNIDPRGLQVVGLGLFNGAGKSFTVGLPAPAGAGVVVSIQPVILRGDGQLRLGLPTVMHYVRPDWASIFGN